MNPEARQLIATETGFRIAQTEPVTGGFTVAEKFVARGEKDGHFQELFVKLGHVAVHASEAIVLDTEAAMYELIARYESLQRHFPALHAYIKNESYRILLLDYLADATWGGPWTEQNLTLIHRALTEIHQTQLSQNDITLFNQKATYLRDTLAQTNPNTFVSQERKLDLFHIAWDNNSGNFTNARGQTYYHASPHTGQAILDHADLASSTQTPTVADVNFGNIGFTANQAYIVDPVYLTMGNPATDMAALGINILRDMTDDNPLRRQVKQLFINDQSALADCLTYWVGCTALPYLPGLEAWMDYHQSCAETGLMTWQEMYPKD